VIEPADVVFLEGNQPFLLEEVAPLIGIRAVYLTNDSSPHEAEVETRHRLSEKYEPTYFRNRFFRSSS